MATFKETNNRIDEFIEEIESEKKRKDAYTLLEIFERVSGYPPQMWAETIIGFGKYHYKYESGHSGYSSIVAFSPRKARISLYIALSEAQRTAYLSRLGKHKAGKLCIYVNKLDDIDLAVLEEMIRDGVAYVKSRYLEV